MEHPPRVSAELCRPLVAHGRFAADARSPVPDRLEVDSRRPGRGLVEAVAHVVVGCVLPRFDRHAPGALVGFGEGGGAGRLEVRDAQRGQIGLRERWIRQLPSPPHQEAQRSERGVAPRAQGFRLVETRRLALDGDPHRPHGWPVAEYRQESPGIRREH